MQWISVCAQWFRGWAQIIGGESSDLTLREVLCFIVQTSFLQAIRTERMNRRVYRKVRPSAYSVWLHFHACLSEHVCLSVRVLYLSMCEPCCLCFRLSSRQFTASHQQLSAIDCVFRVEMEPAGYFGIILWTKMKVRKTLGSQNET